MSPLPPRVPYVPPTPAEYAQARVTAAKFWLADYRENRHTMLEFAHLAEIGAKHMTTLIDLCERLLAAGADFEVHDTDDLVSAPTPPAGSLRQLASGLEDDTDAGTVDLNTSTSGSGA